MIDSEILWENSVYTEHCTPSCIRACYKINISFFLDNVTICRSFYFEILQFSFQQVVFVSLYHLTYCASFVGSYVK